MHKIKAINEAALAAFIMGDHINRESLYKNRGIFGFAVAQEVAKLAVSFEEETRNIDWEEFGEDPTKFGFPSHLTDYEDAVAHRINRFCDGYDTI